TPLTLLPRQSPARLDALSLRWQRLRPRFGIKFFDDLPNRPQRRRQRPALFGEPLARVVDEECGCPRQKVRARSCRPYGSGGPAHDARAGALWYVANLGQRYHDPVIADQNRLKLPGGE